MPKKKPAPEPTPEPIAKLKIEEIGDTYQELFTNCVTRAMRKAYDVIREHITECYPDVPPNAELVEQIIDEIPQKYLDMVVAKAKENEHAQKILESHRLLSASILIKTLNLRVGAAVDHWEALYGAYLIGQSFGGLYGAADPELHERLKDEYHRMIEEDRIQKSRKAKQDSMLSRKTKVLEIYYRMDTEGKTLHKIAKDIKSKLRGDHLSVKTIERYIRGELDNGELDKHTFV